TRQEPARPRSAARPASRRSNASGGWPASILSGPTWSRSRRPSTRRAIRPSSAPPSCSSSSASRRWRSRSVVADAVVSCGDQRRRVADIAAVARQRRRVALSKGAHERIAAARAVVERHLAEDAPVYGLTTGLGAGVDTRLAPDDLAAFQRRVAFAR